MIPAREAARAVSGMSDPSLQVQVNGIDLTAKEIHAYASPVSIDFSNRERVLASTVPIEPVDGWWHLEPGAYMIVYNEKVSIPLDRVGLLFPRSSLMAGGVFIATAVWDSGFRGRGRGMVIVGNKHGANIKVGARVAQLVLFKTERVEAGYSGIHQGDQDPPAPLPRRPTPRR